MAEICVVGWDHDRVIIPEVTTSVLARYNTNPPQPYIEDFVRKGLFTYGDVERWVAEHGKEEYAGQTHPDELGLRQVYYKKSGIKTVGDVADMLTDFLYKMQKDGKPVITKDQAVEAKNYLLRGLTAQQVQAAIEGVPLTPGFQEAFSRFKDANICQTLFSDGLGIAVEHQGYRLNFSDYGGVPAKVTAVINPVCGFFADLLSGDLTLGAEDFEHIELTGEIGKYDKWEEFFESIKVETDDLSEVAVIDDSASNIKPMKRVQEAGGIAIAFNPTEAHMKQFREAGIPVLKQEVPNLEPFADIVLAESSAREVVIGRYCV